MKNIRVYPDSALNDPELLSDYPINLRYESLMARTDLLPQMRFLHHDQKILSLTFEVLLWCARNSILGIGDR